MRDEIIERLMEVLRTETQTWWAEKTETSQSMVSKYWFEGKYPNGEKLIKILELKNISANWVFFNIGPKSLSLLDENEVERQQDVDRRTQINILKLRDENNRIKKDLKKCQIELMQNKVIKTIDEKINDKDDSITNALAFVKMVIDIICKMAELYSKDNIDQDGYMKILEWMEENTESQRLSTLLKLEDLKKIIS